MKKDNSNLHIGFGHSLILSHTPDKVIGLIQEKTLKQVQCPDGKCTTNSFGLFDSSSPNYTTFYPEVTKEDFEPKDEDFIKPTFRLLSAVTVHRNYSPVYFPEQLLKDSMNLLVGQTVNVDHETAIGNAIGVVESVSWQDSYKDKSGVIVPAGINGTLKIDAKSNPRIARGILMTPPSIHSNSVTISFGWEMSHPEMSSDEFYNKIGTYDKDGKLIQKVANKIHFYHETSLVSHGADPFAQKVDNNKINNPIDGGIKDDQLSFSFYSYKTDNLKEGTRLELQSTKDINTKIQVKQMKDFLKLVQDALKLEVVLTEENFKAELDTAIKDKVLVLASEYSSIKDNLEKFDSKFSGIKLSDDGFLNEEDAAKFINDYSNLSSFAEVGKQKLADDKKEAIRLYELTAGEGKDEAIIETMKNADSKATTAFLKQYKELADKDFPITCDKCGSDEVTRRSTTNNSDTGENVPYTNLEDVTEHFKQKRFIESSSN